MKVNIQETKRGNPALLIILVVISLLLVTVYYREGEHGVLHTVRSGVLAVSAPISRVGDVIATPFDAVGNWFSGVGVARSELAALRTQNAELRGRVTSLQEASLENARLRALLNFSGEQNYTKLSANVIGKPGSSLENVVIINRGSADGVAASMPVVAAGGLFGQVYEVSQHSAKVRLLTDQRSGVGAMVQSTRAIGVVKGSVDGQLSLDFVTGNKVPKVSDVVITSGLGGVFPKGLVIGDVSTVVNDRGDLYPQVAIQSRLQLDDVEEVLVLLSSSIEATKTGGSK